MLSNKGFLLEYLLLNQVKGFPWYPKSFKLQETIFWVNNKHLPNEDYLPPNFS